VFAAVGFAWFLWSSHNGYEGTLHCEYYEYSLNKAEKSCLDCSECHSLRFIWPGL